MSINDIAPGTKFRTSYKGIPGPHIMERIADQVFDGRIYNAAYSVSNLRTTIDESEIVVPCRPANLFDTEGE